MHDDLAAVLSNFGHHCLRSQSDDHRRAFTAFVAGLLADFDRYLDRTEEPDLLADGVGYRQVALWLTADELTALTARLNEAVLAQLGNEPGPGRVRRLFSTVLLPAAGPS